MKFFSGEESRGDNLCTSNMNARWINPSVIHANA
jgi:hypothetical protein